LGIWRCSGREELILNGCTIKYIPNPDILDKWWTLHLWRLPLCCPLLTQVHLKFYFLSQI
jgi:hypothetical protein